MHNFREQAPQTGQEAGFDFLHQQLLADIRMAIDSLEESDRARLAARQSYRAAQESLQELRQTLSDYYLGEDRRGRDIYVSGRIQILNQRQGQWFIDPMDADNLELTTLEVQVPSFDPRLHDTAEKYDAEKPSIMAEDRSHHRYYVPIDEGNTIAFRNQRAA